MVMDMRKEKLKVSLGLPRAILFIVSLLIPCIGYFVYGGWNGFMAMLVYEAVLGLSTILSVIPFIGVILVVFIDYFWLMPSVFSLTGIGETWLTIVVFLIVVTISLIVCLVMSMVALMLTRD